LLAQVVSPGFLRPAYLEPHRGERRVLMFGASLSPFQGLRSFSLADPGLAPWAMVVSRLWRSAW